MCSTLYKLRAKLFEFACVLFSTIVALRLHWSLAGSCAALINEARPLPRKEVNVMKPLIAMMALVVGLTFVGVTFVQADEKAAPAAPAAGKKEEKKVEKKTETKTEKK